MANYLSPFATRQFIDANGNPYTGAKLFTYAVGSTTKATTYKNESGSSAHANPIILNTKGEPADGSGVAYPIWQAGGTAMKYVLAPSTDTDPPVSPIETWDNIDGINDTSISIDQWISGGTPTYVSATSFTLVGDQTTTYHVGRRIKTTNSGGTIYSTITASVYTTLTTLTVVNDSGALDSGLSAVSYGLISAANNSVPGGTHEADTTWNGKTYFTNGIGPNYLQNIGIAPSVASKALTVALKTKALADASATDFIQIAFRNVTLTTGDYVIRSATAATSVVAPSGATLGFTASQTGYIYVYALDNAGTPEAILSGSNHWDEGAVHTTTAITTAADSGSVLYSTTARTNVPIRYVCRIKIQTGAVAGEWDNEDTEVSVGYTNNAAADQGLTVASATTTNIWNGGNSKHISGTTTITSFGTAPYAGATKRVIFDGALILTHAANLNLPTAANITTAAGDSCVVYADTTTQLDILSYHRASGLPLFGTLVSGTVIPTTSGTSFTFTGIPSGVKKITLALSNVSTNAGGSGLKVRLGDSGGIESTGYVSTLAECLAASVSTTSETTAFLLDLFTASTDDVSGVLILVLVDASTNTWAASGNFSRTSGAVAVDCCSGVKSLSATLDRVELLISANAFDAGKFQIHYE